MRCAEQENAKLGCRIVFFFLLTGLFEAGLHPLREPAQVTVTVQGVSAESPADTHTHTHYYKSNPQHLNTHTYRYMVLHSQVGQSGEVVERSFRYG